MLSSHRHGAEIMLRTSGDDTFATIKPAPSEGGGVHDTEAHEVFWKILDLTGQDLVLGQMQYRVAPGEGVGSFESRNSQAVYIKLVPLTDEEASALLADRRRTDTRRLFAHDDAHGVHYAYRPTTAEHIRRNIEPYRHTDFSRLCWEAGGGDLLQYLGNTGRRSTFDGLEDFGPQGYRKLAESWRIFRDKGIDPFQVALDYTHEIGMEFHAGYRVTAFHYPPPIDYFNHGPSFYKGHPELRAIDKDGNATPRISYAFPEVRRYVVSVLREVAGYDVDGICLLYNRRPPFLEYEPPMVEGFKAEYGDDPREIEDNDPRWLSYRSRTMTQFHREVREAMDDEARKQSRRRIEISAIVSGRPEDNELHGLDLEAWIEEGLVDTLIPYTTAPNLDSQATAWSEARQVAPFVNLTKGTSCKLSVSILPRWQTPEDYRRAVKILYDAGVEDFFFWDCDPGRSESFRRLGHKEDIEEWRQAGGPSLAPPTMKVRKLGDWDLSYLTPG